MFSDYVIYVDESGDHGLNSVQEPYPVFVLSFCIFRKSDYASSVVPTFLNFKFQFFGHDNIVLHGNEIRKEAGALRILVNAALRQQFIESLDEAIRQAPFTLIASVIDKAGLRNRYANPDNPYEIALRFCLERSFSFLRGIGQGDKKTTVIVECRGKKEDDELELAFLRIVAGDNRWGRIPLELGFADKKANLIGLQIADLVSHPIGRHHLKPDQPNRAYDSIVSKFRHSTTGEIKGWGLKTFP